MHSENTPAPHDEAAGNTFSFNFLRDNLLVLLIVIVSLIWTGAFMGSLLWFGTEQIVTVAIIAVVVGIALALGMFLVAIPRWVRRHEVITLGDDVIHSRLHGDIRLADIVSFGTMSHNGLFIKIKTRTVTCRYAVSQLKSLPVAKAMAVRVQAMIDRYNVEQDWTGQTDGSTRHRIADNSFFKSTWGLICVIVFTLITLVILFSPAVQTALKITLFFGAGGLWAGILGARNKNGTV